jgi:phenylalanine ammonia-lyase
LVFSNSHGFWLTNALRHGGSVGLHPDATRAIIDSAEAVHSSLSKGQIFYGVNTGFGGSADTRPEAVEELQRELLRGLHYGILSDPWTQKRLADTSQLDVATLLTNTSLPIDHPTAATCMPEAWVRASMLIRLNSLAGGVSGAKLSTVDTLAQLINKDIVPRIPIRGSISASGDLSPLSYIGGVMQGKPSLTVWMGDRSPDGSRRVTKARNALFEAGIKPVILGPKEGLAIVNGTAVSAGVGALALHEAHCQAALAQVLTAMTVEALQGTDESFDPFLAKVRPHPGQIESARNIFAFLAESKLVYRADGSEEFSLRQDRYSIRTASQWIGPVLEDLALAHEQLVIEINSVTDNPLIDTAGGRILHGGNFQAKVVTSAMEKIRQGCQTLGRMLSVQCSELINPTTSRGLPPNLVVDEPSESYIWKGTDIMIAALQSELGFLANPVGTHVQTAEMGNQSLNSLALISSRYTLDALDVLSQLAAAHLLALCQALDLRAMHLSFLEAFAIEFREYTDRAFIDIVRDEAKLEDLQKTLWTALKQQLDRTTSVDSGKRFELIIEALQPLILKSTPDSLDALKALGRWSVLCSERALELFHITRSHYMRNPNAVPFLGAAARRMYLFVRERLQVPFFGEDGIRTPDPEPIDSGVNPNLDQQDAPTVGSFITTIYESIRTGALYDPVIECFRNPMPNSTASV